MKLSLAYSVDGHKLSEGPSAKKPSPGAAGAVIPFVSRRFAVFAWNGTTGVRINPLSGK